jgi:hypothetical protein
MSDNLEFIYLMPGNWFETKNIDTDKTCPFDLENFKAEMTNQINNRNEKLDFINISFSGGAGHNIIEEILFHLDETKFSTMAKILTTEKRHPIITFHGTNLDAAKSILANGYVIPQLNKNNNVSVKVSNGALYGIGVYTSPFYDKALYYCRNKTTKYVHILVNMVFLGVMKLIPPNNSLLRTNYSAPINGVYADGSNTRIVYGLEQIISADPNKVFPIAILKIKVE